MKDNFFGGKIEAGLSSFVTIIFEERKMNFDVNPTEGRSPCRF